MIKNSLAFLAGSVLITGIVISAGGRPAAFVGLGFFLAVSLGAGVLWLTGVRRLARFLDAFILASSDDRASLQGGRVRHAAIAPRVDRSGYRKPSTKQRNQILEDTMEEYLPDDIFAPAKTAGAGRVQ